MTLLLLLSACIWVTDDEVATREAKLLDFDEDGYDGVNWGGEDCDDFNPRVHPGRDETPYDGIDNDCDEETPDDDLDDDGFDIDVDCDDQNTGVHPGATEVCDGADNDCNDETDDGVLIAVYADTDDDGYGDPDVSDEACEVEEGWSDNDLDCNDESADFSPEADEICDGLDNDCNDLVDDEDTPVDPSIFYEDFDDDGYGTGSSTTTACELPDGYASNASDCNDNAEEIYPGGLERLWDEDDGDCDGDDDTFEFAAMDTRDSAYVRGPRVFYASGSSGPEIHVGWSAVSYDDGSGKLWDGMLASTWDADDPLGTEADFFGEGASSSLGTTGEAADFLATSDYFFWARNFDDSPDGRIFQIDMLDRNTGQTGKVGWQESGVNTLFDDLQVGFSAGQNVTAVGCSTRGGGMELTQISVSYLISGYSAGAWHDFDGGSSYSRCDYDDASVYAVYASTGVVDPPLRVIGLGSDLYVAQTWSGSSYTFTDVEITWQHDYRAFGLSLDYSSSSDSLVLYGQDLAAGTESEYLQVYMSEAIKALDVSPAPTGEVYACAVGDSGTTWLVSADPIGADSSRIWELETDITVEDCGLSVTDNDLIAIALREGDDLYLGWVGI